METAEGNLCLGAPHSIYLYPNPSSYIPVQNEAPLKLDIKVKQAVSAPFDNRLQGRLQLTTRCREVSRIDAPRIQAPAERIAVALLVVCYSKKIVSERMKSAKDRAGTSALRA